MLSSSRKSLVRFAAALTVATVALAGCSSSNNNSEAGDAGDTLTIVTPDTGISWALDNAFGGLEAANNLQATLLRKPYVDATQDGAQQQDTYTYDPYLASGYTVSDDGLTYTFTLTEAKSAAGNTLSADDVLWSFERKFGTPTSLSPGIMAPSITDPASQIVKIDDRTVSFTLPQAGLGTTFLALMSDLLSQIYDSTLLKEHVTADDPYAVKWSAENPNYGFGAYEVTEYEPGVRAVLKAREDWIGGEIPIDTVNLRIVSDAGTRANAVKNGDAQVATAVTPADSAGLSSDSNVFVPQVDNPNMYLMMPLVTNKAPFDNPLVRKAMAYATPYQPIVDDVYRGLAARNGSGFLLQDAPGYTNEGQIEYTYDPIKAKELLAEAGFPNGVSFSLAVNAADPDTREAAIQIQTAAREGGFDIQIDQMPGAQFSQQRSEHTSQAFILRDYAITLTPPYELTVYTAPDSSNNFADWQYQPFTDALDAGNALPDALSDEAGKAWNEAEKIYVDQSPIVFIAQVQPSVVLSSDVAGFAQRSDNWIDYANLSYK
ncbi:ABC transporter substrate-binding protein [Rhodococcoides yunnanense]|uniref:ABC transporter substrate-binding protein n=1 Tax=Rhodococcoides yunnanense TaxID=278209 RepID=UPI000934D54E|nr:ABC transporter substrate-binding protein [Rhodococcus yunnanensis]